MKQLNANHKLYCYDIANDEVLLASTVPDTANMPVFPALNIITARRRADKIKNDFQKFQTSYVKAERELSEKLLQSDGCDTESEGGRGA